jgi:hypothetical protein
MPSAHCDRYSPTRAKSYHLPASASGSHDAQAVVSHSRQRYSQIPDKKSTATFTDSTKRPTVSVPRHGCPQGWRLSVRATGLCRGGRLYLARRHVPAGLHKDKRLSLPWASHPWVYEGAGSKYGTSGVRSIHRCKPLCLPGQRAREFGGPERAQTPCITRTPDELFHNRERGSKEGKREKGRDYGPELRKTRHLSARGFALTKATS